MQTYGELKAEIANWLDRTDQTDNIPKFIRLAEGDIYRDLRCRQNLFVARIAQTAWTINGVTQPDAPPPTGLINTLPQNYKEMRLVTWNDRPLREVSEQDIQGRLLSACDSEPRVFAQIGRDIFYSAAIPDDPSAWNENDQLSFTYYGTESLDSFPTWQTSANPVDNPAVEDTTPEGLTQTDANTTRLLQHAPDLYLSGAMMWAHRLLREPEMAQVWKATFDEARGRLGDESEDLTGSTTTINSIYGD